MNGLSVNEIEWIEGMEWNGLCFVFIGTKWMASFNQIISIRETKARNEIDWWIEVMNEGCRRQENEFNQSNSHIIQLMKVNGFNERSERAEGIGILTVSL